MEIVAFSGFARSGKDEAAKVLVEEFGFRRIAFADKLREVLYQLNPFIGVEVEYYEINVGFKEEVIRSGHTEKYVYLQDVIDECGWDGYKETQYGPEIRRLLQRLGTEAGRQTLWDSVWIDIAFKDVGDDEKIVVTDGRFFNEFDAVRARGGVVWRIERPGVGPANDHASELEAIDYPHFEGVLHNDGSVQAWHDKCRYWFDPRRR